jgi:hypothetical protein
VLLRRQQCGSLGQHLLLRRLLLLPLLLRVAVWGWN